MQDVVDQQMKSQGQRPAMQLVMGGKFAQQIICKNVNFRSEKEEDFYQVTAQFDTPLAVVLTRAESVSVAKNDLQGTYPKTRNKPSTHCLGNSKSRNKLVAELYVLNSYPF